MKYLRKSLEIWETLFKDKEVLQINANIFLNLSSVHSLRSEHDIALGYCNKAISILTSLYNKIIMEREKLTEENTDKDEDQNQVFYFLILFSLMLI